MDGQPVGGATVMFHNLGQVPADHRTFITKADASGQYKIDSIYPGTYEVVAGEGAPAEGSGGAAAMESAAAEPELQPADGGQLQVEIGAEPVVYDIKLKRKR